MINFSSKCINYMQYFIDRVFDIYNCHNTKYYFFVYLYSVLFLASCVSYITLLLHSSRRYQNLRARRFEKKRRQKLWPRKTRLLSSLFLRAMYHVYRISCFSGTHTCVRSTYRTTFAVEETWTHDRATEPKGETASMR